jgi:two-component system phosphate regulon response regulator PhoB
MSALILIIEDEPDLARTVAYNVEKEGFSTEIASTGAAGIQRAIREPHPDLVLLDLMLPDLSGHDVCEQIRSHAATTRLPIIMLTARGEEEDRVKGFEKGADDYVTKPFSVRELLARVRAVLRRSGGSADQKVSILVSGTLRLDIAAHRAWVDEQEIILTAIEYRLICTLMERQGRVQSRSQLIDEVWGMGTAITNRTVDVHVKRLRGKLGSVASGYIDTVWGVGYRFNVPDAQRKS